MINSTSTKLPPANPDADGLHISSSHYGALLDWLRTQHHVRRAWMFGSRVKGERSGRRPDSTPDIDVAVELDPLSERFDPVVYMFDIHESLRDYFDEANPTIGLSGSPSIPTYVHVEWLEPGSKVAGFVNAASRLFYERGEHGD